MTAFPDLDRLIAVLEVRETGHMPDVMRDDAIGDGGAAVGRLQIHVGVVQDCNRILRRAVYAPDDRRDAQKARGMAGLYLRHWGARLPDMGTADAVEALARVWNGGPNGWRKSATIGYGKAALTEWRRQARKGDAAV